ncbi:TetR/AcrR family transcriptional regulator [Antrihabitans cavernicola]|uniref:TetR/AcrR family transcriptional regulator n=1 Tax=Antrihabitans cavernicola TaxID=2495913 RepID=A0A5A7SAP0_9NOCA|nr:TetR/AcrR family transcriptional regulator [Spelaeibacter cavernicola]KAA0022986.1 TetR/AcrR family transcriptional regulator [Spelaeibacter cavernicola]
MGNREDLMAGARKAILEHGLANTTARDIATAAGVSLAAIGYHFGSKDRLITEALNESLGSGIGDAMETLIRDTGATQSLPEAFAATWNGMRDVLERNRDGLMLSFENGSRIARSPEAQQHMTNSIGGVYDDLAAVVRTTHPDLNSEQARSIAQLYFVLLQGFATLSLLTPEGELPDGDDLARAVAALSGR